MALPFRQRIFGILVALTAVPTALAVVGWALAVRTVAPSAGARVALEDMAASARLMVDRMDTTHLSARERAAFREHLDQLSNSVTLARRAETYLRYYAGGFAAGGFLVRGLPGVPGGTGGGAPFPPPVPPPRAAGGVGPPPPPP